MKILTAVRRLWKLATCEHRNTANWPLWVPDVEVEGQFVELRFCRACGRLIWACRSSDQPQYNSHWLDVDQLDPRPMRHPILPESQELRDLAERGLRH